MSYCFLSVGTVGAVRCVRTINSVKVFVEAYVTCNDAYTCAIPCAIVEVVSKNFERLLVVIAKYKISMCVSVSVPSFMSKAVNFVVNHVFDVVEWDKAAYQVAAHRFIAPVSRCVCSITEIIQVSSSTPRLHYSKFTLSSRKHNASTCAAL